ncbi:MAG: flagellar M-ring protein FliF, partial [Primorskyibacter sp.]
MEQIISSWNGLDLRKKVIVTVATIAMFAALVVMAQIASKPSMSLLYADLDDSAAADVLTALEQRGIAHEVRARAIY